MSSTSSLLRSGDPPLKAARIEPRSEDGSSTGLERAALHSRHGGQTLATARQSTKPTDISTIPGGTSSDGRFIPSMKLQGLRSALSTAMQYSNDKAMRAARSDATAQAELIDFITELEVISITVKAYPKAAPARASAIHNLRVCLAKNHAPSVLTALQPSFDSIVLPVLTTVIEDFVAASEKALHTEEEPVIEERPRLKRRRPGSTPLLGSTIRPESLAALLEEARATGKGEGKGESKGEGEAETTATVTRDTAVGTAVGNATVVGTGNGFGAAGSAGKPAVPSEDEVFDALWCLINVSAGDSQMTRIVLKHGIVSLMVRLLKCTSSPEVIENAIWVCGNISGDGTQGREELFRAQVLELLVGLVATELQAIGYYPYIDEDSTVLADENPGVCTHAERGVTPDDNLPEAHEGDNPPTPCMSCESEKIVPWYTSNVLQVATWVLLSMCEGQPRPMLPLDLLLPVFNACLECPDPEVQSHVSWALSHICDGPPEHIFTLLCNLRCLKNPNVRKALHMLPTCSPGDFCMEAVGVWTPQQYSPVEDVTLASFPPPQTNRKSMAAVQHMQSCYPNLLVDAEAVRNLPSSVMKYTQDRYDNSQILVPSTAAKLIRMLRHDSIKVSKPALRALGNIVCAEDERDFTQAVVNLGLVPLLRVLMDHSVRELQKEACWTMSNVAAGTASQIQAVLDSGCIPRVLYFCIDNTADVGVRTEACWVLLNAISCGNEKQIEMLVRAGGIRVLCTLLSDPSMMMMALDGLEKIMQVGERLSLSAAHLVRSKGRGAMPVLSGPKSPPGSQPKKPSTGASPAKSATSPAIKETDHADDTIPDDGALSKLAGDLPGLKPSALGPAALKALSNIAPLQDGPLEEILLNEAKLLLETCRVELLNKHRVGTGAPGSVAGPVAGGKSDAVFKKAEKLWANHFVTCELCHCIYSKNSNATVYCEECRCFVCGSCDCSRYHLSYQLALLEDFDDDSSNQQGKSGKQKNKSKSKKGKKVCTNTKPMAHVESPDAAGKRGESPDAGKVTSAARSEHPPAAAAEASSEDEEDLTLLIKGTVSEKLKPVSKAAPKVAAQPRGTSKGLVNVFDSASSHAGPKPAKRPGQARNSMKQESPKPEPPKPESSIKAERTLDPTRADAGTGKKLAGGGAPASISKQVASSSRTSSTVAKNGSSVRNPTNPWGKSVKQSGVEAALNDVSMPLPAMDMAASSNGGAPSDSRRTWRAVVSGSEDQHGSNAALEAPTMVSEESEAGHAEDWNGLQGSTGGDVAPEVSLPFPMMPQHHAQAILQLALTMPHLIPPGLLSLVPQILYGHAPDGVRLGTGDLPLRSPALTAEDFPPLAGPQKLDHPPVSSADATLNAPFDPSASASLNPAGAAVLLPGVHLPAQGSFDASGSNGLMNLGNMVPSLHGGVPTVGEMGMSQVPSSSDLMAGLLNGVPPYGSFYGPTAMPLWHGAGSMSVSGGMFSEAVPSSSLSSHGLFAPPSVLPVQPLLDMRSGAQSRSFSFDVQPTETRQPLDFLSARQGVSRTMQSSFDLSNLPSLTSVTLPDYVGTGAGGQGLSDSVMLSSVDAQDADETDSLLNSVTRMAMLE